MTEPVRIGPGVAAGIDEAMIQRLVHTFYERVRQEPTLGPIFNAAIDDWPAHLAKLCDFWSSVMLMTGRFKGSPMAAHARNAAIQHAHFALWLDLFARTAGEVCPSAAATLFGEKSRMIGRSLTLGLSVSRGEIPPLRREDVG